MIYLKYMPFHSAGNASRNRRELAAAAEYGFETLLVSNDQFDPGGAERHLWDGSTPVTPQMTKVEKILKILLNDLRVWRSTCRLPDGVWSCHDLGSLRLAWIATRFRRRKPTLIYDSHEFELGRNIARSTLEKWSVLHWERFLMRRCAFAIVVNDTIADALQRIHCLEQRPIVVRSTPGFWGLEQAYCQAARQELISAFATRD